MQCAVRPSPRYVRPYAARTAWLVRISPCAQSGYALAHIKGEQHGGGDVGKRPAGNAHDNKKRRAQNDKEWDVEVRICRRASVAVAISNTVIISFAPRCPA